MANKIADKNNLILEFIKENRNVSSKEIHDGLAGELAYATVKRTLQNLVAENLLSINGKGKATRYQVSPAYELLHPVDLDQYFKKEIDEREVRHGYNHSLLDLLGEVPVFTAEELNRLNTLHQWYLKKTSNLSETEYHQELERLAIDVV